MAQATAIDSIPRGSSLKTSTTFAWEDEMGATSDQVFFVTSYSDFDALAHGPRGTKAKNSIYVYRFHPVDGSLVLLNVCGADVKNPAFSRFHPRLNVVYTCTEDIDDNGKVYAYCVGSNGELTQLGDPVDAGGTSTCYLTVSKDCRHMLCVNYWNSTLGVIPLDDQSGGFAGPIKNMYDPAAGHKMVSTGRHYGGVNHSMNDESTIRMRQADPHSHALVLDPFEQVIAYVPDLGKDLIREFIFDNVNGKIISEMNVLPSGMCTGHPDGPRYFEFHPRYSIAYCVNELSSTISVFEVDRVMLQEIATASRNNQDMTQFRGRTSLRLIQSVNTIPCAFPTTMNTCGRICVHKSGRFVLVSNRGHESIAIFRVVPATGELVAIGYFHTRGETPRHFQFDASGQYLLVANQDTDCVAVFSFNLGSGMITYTGNEYRVPSPNFVCNCPARPEEGSSGFARDSVTVSNLQLLDRGTPTTSTPPSSTEVSVSADKQLLLELEKAREEISRLKILLDNETAAQAKAE